MMRRELLLTSILGSLIVVAAAVSLLVSGGKTAPLSSSKSAPSVAVSISLRPLTSDEFSGVGTHGIVNATAADFQKLSVDVMGKNLGKRTIRVPTARELTDALSDQVVWFTHSTRQDNPGENHANYHMELVLFTRKTDKQMLNEKLKAFSIGVSYENADRKPVTRAYPLALPISESQSLA